MSLPAGANVVLNADDYGLTAGVSRGILELASLGRLSATSAMVTFAHWPDHAADLKAQHGTIATGLHVNLTLGAPCAAMPETAPAGRLPALGTLLRAAVAGKLALNEIEAEVGRQIARYQAAMGRAPDFIDGHQHVHALPGVRRAFRTALMRAFPSGRRPLVRDPADQIGRILARKRGAAKHLALHALCLGFGSGIRAAGFSTNDSFAGVSAFDRRVEFGSELDSFFIARGSCHIVMCHPGWPDATLRELDPVVERRQDELEALRDAPGLHAAIWQPTGVDTGPVWPHLQVTA